MRHALRSQARAEREAGFTLVEIVVAMLLMAIIMSSIAVFFLGSTKASTALRVRQNAAVVANNAMDFVHSVKPDQLLIGRDKSSSDSQWTTGVIGVDLTTMTELYDTSSPAPAVGAGSHATLPTTKVLTTVNKTPFSTSYFIGKCYVPEGGGDCTKTGPTTAVALDRVVVAVNWSDLGSTCPGHICAYVIASLISPGGDPTFDKNQVIVDTTPPSTPSNLVCTTPSTAAAGGDISIKNIGWDASSDASGVAEYDVWLGTAVPFDKTSASWKLLGTLPTTSSTYVASGLVPLTTYYIAVLAKDTAGNLSGPHVPIGTVDVPQPPFLKSCTTLADNVSPSAPTNLTATGATTNTTSFAWTAGTDDYKVGGYQVFRAGTSLPIATLGSTASSYTDTGLATGVTYTYTVKTVDVAGNTSSASNAVAILTKDTTKPTVPTGVAATVDPTVKTTLNLTWTASTDNVGVTGYQLCRSTSSSFPTGPTTVCATTTTTSYASRNLPTNTKYYFEVCAYDAALNYSAYATASATTPDTQAPTVPTALASPSKTANTVTLGWTASSDNVLVTGYNIYRNGTLVSTTSSPTVTFTDSGLGSHTSYVYTVAAFDAAGNVSAPGNAVTVVTLPAALTALSSPSHTGTTITLNWAPSADAGVTGYAIYVDGATTPVGSVNQGIYTYTVGGLAAGTQHTFTVKVYAGTDYSRDSNVVTVTTSGCGTTNIALNRPAVASSYENQSSYPASAAFDGNTGTRWSSAFSDPQSIYVDLGSVQSICKVVLSWETAAGKAFQIQTSNDLSTWTPIYSTTTGPNGPNVQTLTVTGSGRYVRMYGTARTTGYGYSLYEFQVYGGAP